MPPIHIPAWPVSTTTIASSGAWRVSSRQRRSGRIGTASDSSSWRYFAAYSSHRLRTVAAQGFGIDVDLDRRDPDLRHGPEVRGHAARLGADEEDEIGHGDDAIRALARIAADHPHREGMRAVD